MTAGRFAASMAMLVAGLAIYAVPHPGRLLLLAAVGLGLAVALWRLKRSEP